MRRILLAACMAGGLCLSSSAALAGYSAIAVGVGGEGFAQGYPTMESARAAAVRRCREQGGSCSISTAEDDSWSYSGGYCNGLAYTGASPQGWQRADEIVRMKGAVDGNFDCDIQFHEPRW